MFEFSTNSIIIIAVCVVAIILLLFLYLYISRKEKQGRVMTDPEKSTDNSLASEQAQKPLAAVPQAEEGKATQPTQAFAAEAQKARHFSQEEELAASVEELLGKEEAAAIEAQPIPEPEPTPEPEKFAEPEAVSDLEKVAGPEAAPEPEKAAEPEPVSEPVKAVEPEPVSEPVEAAEPEPAPELEKAAEPAQEPEKTAKQDGPDLSALYQEVDEEDYEQVGTDVADAIALAFEKVVGQETPAAEQNVRGRIGQEAAAVVEETQKEIEIPIGTARRTAPGSVRRNRSIGN